MYTEAAKIVGRYESENGQAIHVAISDNINCPGQKPFEIMVLRYPDKTNFSISTAQRVILEATNRNKAQGQVSDLHGERGFHNRGIKDFKLEVIYADFFSAGGKPIIKASLIIKEFR